jgi:methyl coenzyme M reductase beta subunit
MVVSPDAATRKALEAKVAKLAWSKEFKGLCAYASTAASTDVKLTGASAAKDAVLVIEPDIFGVSGAVVTAVPAGDVDTKLAGAMRDALAKHVRANKSREQLKRMALAQGIFFETGIPVSGKKEAEDREKYKQELEKRKAAGSTAPKH